MYQLNRFRIIAVGTLLLSCGCYPAVVTRLPRVTERVTDERGTPLHGAEVTINRGGGEVDAVKPKSQQDGRFERAARTKWHMVPLVFPNLAGPHFKCTASFDGNESAIDRWYGTPTTQVRFMGLGKVDTVDVGNLVVPTSAR